jgi:hypothetical protein
MKRAMLHHHLLLHLTMLIAIVVRDAHLYIILASRTVAGANGMLDGVRWQVPITTRSGQPGCGIDQRDVEAKASFADARNRFIV